jgi:hypothetical protein
MTSRVALQPAKPLERRSTDPTRPEHDRKDLVRFYRTKANECMSFAESTRDEKFRAEWIRLANVWSQLAVHIERRAR